MGNAHVCTCAHACAGEGLRTWSGILPFPPSLNRYYRHVGYKVLISRDGREYRKTLERMFAGFDPFRSDVSFSIHVYPPDNRRRDLDNLLKGLQDAMTHAGFFTDDCQIKRLEMEMHDPDRNGGHLEVYLSARAEKRAEIGRRSKLAAIGERKELEERSTALYG